MDHPIPSQNSNGGKETAEEVSVKEKDAKKEKRAHSTDDTEADEPLEDTTYSDEISSGILIAEIPKGRVRKTSIVEKLSKSKESELIALSIMESAGQRQREF